MSKATPEGEVTGEDSDYRSVLLKKAQGWMVLLRGSGVYRQAGFPILFANEMTSGRRNSAKEAFENVHILLARDINSRTKMMSRGVAIVTLGISISLVEPPSDFGKPGRQRVLKFEEEKTIYFDFRKEDGGDYQVVEKGLASYGDLRFFNSILKKPRFG